MKYMFPSILLFTVLILVIPGVLVKYYKVYWLISGYNTMSREKKEKVDIEGLSGFIGNVCFAMAAIIICAGAAAAAGKTALAGVVFALLVPVSIYMLVKAQKYDGNTRNPDGTMNNKTKLVIGAVSSFLIITLIGVVLLLFQSSKPSGFKISDGQLVIKGLYGQSINMKDIKRIELLQSLPEITYKINGSALGDKLKGSFRLKDLGEASLFVNKSRPPFIFIDKDPKPVILNCDDAEETKALYGALTVQWGSK